MIKNYYLNSLEVISKFENKPKLLLHSCCAPCNCYIMKWLIQYFDLTLYFNNSNIYPQEEYDIRLNELKKYVKDFNFENKTNVNLIVEPYLQEDFHRLLQKRAQDKEHGKRCFMCYSLRMRQAFAYANANKYDYFTTIMTISRHKNATKLNEIGRLMQSAFINTQYFYSDFKKGDGQSKSIALSLELNLYRQKYCGCKYSYDVHKNKSAS